MPTEDRLSIYASTTSHSDEETDTFYNTIDYILEKKNPLHNCDGGPLCECFEDKHVRQKGRQDASAWASKMKEEALVEWATSKNFKIMNTQFEKKAGMRWRSRDGNTIKNEIDYIITDNRLHGYRRDRHKPHQHWKWPHDGNGLHYAKHQNGKEEAHNQDPHARIDTQMFGTKCFNSK